MATVASLDAGLASLSGDDGDCTRTLLSDLAELLNRHAYRGPDGDFSFHDPAIASLPMHLVDDQVTLIAERVVAVLLDASRTEDIRASSAWVLGKTHSPIALAAIVALVRSSGTLPAELARQCAFAFDALQGSCEGSMTDSDLEAVGYGFRRNGVPWDFADRRVVVDDL